MIRTPLLRPPAASILAIVLLLAGCGEALAPEPAERAVYAVGEGGTVLLFDGNGWAPVTTGAEGVVEAVWGTAEDDLHALTRTHLLHFDGAGWSATTAADAGEEWGRLRGIGGTSPSDAFAVGYANTILHNDGDGWRSMPVSREHNRGFYGVWGSAPDDVFAVGHLGVIWHYDGSAWREMLFGEIDGMPISKLWDVWGSAPDNVLAVGFGGGGPLILHYDGTGWRAMEHPSERPLEGVWGASSTDVFAVGMEGTILHHDGVAWRAMESPTSETLMSVWGTSPEDVFAVGYGGTILHYDGTAWRVMESGTGVTLWGVWGAR
jgi:hypothetical protein